jgi:hypothetical protein
MKMNRALDRLGDDRDAAELIGIALALQAKWRAIERKLAARPLLH